MVLSYYCFDSNGTSCYPQTTNDIPAYAYAGDYGELGLMSCSDGSDIHGIWDLYPAGTVSADFVTLDTVWYGQSMDTMTEVTQTISRAGTVIGYQVSVFIPGYDVSLELSS